MMSLCRSCRAALRQNRISLRPIRHQSTAANPSTSLHPTLSKPTRSIRSLLEPPPSAPSSQSASRTSVQDKITPSQLHHLLRLSALPLPTSQAEEDSMIDTLQRQLHFVRALQSVDTKGVEPLRAIRDERRQGVEDATIQLRDLWDVLEKEEKIGFYRRPRRVRSERGKNKKRHGEVAEREDVEQWDALGMASRTAGRYFVVQSQKKEG